jgi:hypothetical protein
LTNKLFSVLVLSGLAAIPLACGSSDSDGSGSAGGAHAGSAHSAGSHNSGGDGGATAAGGAPAAGSAGAAASALEPPMLESVEPLEGGLHVMWTNMTKDCEKIVLLRSKDGGTFSVAYTLAGAADSQHDGQATAPGTYCYKARCLKGSNTSPDSEEKCGTP